MKKVPLVVYGSKWGLKFRAFEDVVARTEDDCH